jgi:hypothetical protein
LHFQKINLLLKNINLKTKKMKKIYTMLMALLILGVGFAQNNSELTRRSYLKSEPVEFKRTLHTQTSKAEKPEPEFWFFYPEGLQNYFASEEDPIQTYVTALLPDSLGLVEYQDGIGRNMFYSFGQVFDFAEHSIWKSFFVGFPDPNPDMQFLKKFDVDQIGVLYRYTRGTEVPANVVDTLLISIAVDPALQYRFLINQETGVVYHNQAIVPYDLATANIPANAPYTKFQQIRVLLTTEDVTDIVKEKYVDVDQNKFSNLTPNDKVIVTYSFLPGSAPRDLTTMVGKEVNAFAALYAEDPRNNDFFINCRTNPPLSQAMRDEKSISICGMSWNLDSDISLFYKQYSPMSVICGEVVRPYVGVHLTNIISEGSSIAEKASKNISVKPNPATNNFTVSLANTGVAQVELYNLVGQKVFGATTAEQTLNVNVSNFSNGIYMLKVSQNGRVDTLKVVVQ